MRFDQKIKQKMILYAYCVKEKYEELRDCRTLYRIYPDLKKFEKLNNKENLIKLKSCYEDYVAQVSTPDMAISLKTSYLLYFICLWSRSKAVLDLGSGFSSFVFRKYAASSDMDVCIYTVDDNVEWLKKTRCFIDERNLPNKNIITWEEFKEKDFKNHFDFIFHDLGNMNMRANTLNCIINCARYRGIIILDDMHKSSFKKTAKKIVNDKGLKIFSLRKFTLDKFNRYSSICVV
jgi:predicted O-methyltransferase YrrM